MLNDSISDVFQSLMLKEQPESNGLQDPVLAQNMFFTVHHHNPFVQILYDGKLHWIAVSTYWCEPGKVFYFDSLFSLVAYLVAHVVGIEIDTTEIIQPRLTTVTDREKMLRLT